MESTVIVAERKQNTGAMILLGICYLMVLIVVSNMVINGNTQGQLLAAMVSVWAFSIGVPLLIMTGSLPVRVSARGIKTLLIVLLLGIFLFLILAALLITTL